MAATAMVIYSTLDEGALARLVAGAYDLASPDVRLMRRGFNDTYRVTAGGTSYFLRVYLHGKYYIGGRADLQFELDLLDHLSRSGVGVAAPIPLSDGTTLGTLQAPEGVRHFALFEAAPGAPVDEPSEAQRRALGEALAQIHLAADRFATTLPRQRLGVVSLVDASMDRLTPWLSAEDLDFVRSVAARVRALLANLPHEAGAWGIIHGDPHTRNCHYDGERLTFYDFDTCGWGWRGYDLAIALGGPEEPHREALLAGYQSVRPLASWELEALPSLFLARVIWDAGDILTMAPIWGEAAMKRTVMGMVKELRKLG